VDGEHRGGAGGIRALLVLIGEHRDALAYDWRTRFGLPLAAIFDHRRMGYAEAWQLVNQLSLDPTSRLCAALNGWDYPFSTEARILADLWDLTLSANKRRRSKAKPYPRPWRDKGRSAKPTVDQATIRAALAARGH
jgi:hypothetical protein